MTRKMAFFFRQVLAHALRIQVTQQRKQANVAENICVAMGPSNVAYDTLKFASPSDNVISSSIQLWGTSRDILPAFDNRDPC